MSMTVKARACGYRLAGGIYVTTAMSSVGVPVENFLICPPRVIEPAEMGLSPIGTILIEKNGVVHVMDFVGADSYPNVADFVEEVKRQGLSRRIAKNTDFSRLGPDSRIILVHARAHIDNASEYQEARDAEEFWCVRSIENHTSNTYRGMCDSIWWEDVTDGATSSDPDTTNGVLCGRWPSDIPGAHFHRRRREERAIVRTMASFSYRAFARPPGVVPRYRPAMFASFPIGRLDVIYDRTGSTHVEAMERASRSRLAVELMEE